MHWTSPAHLIVLTHRGRTARTRITPEGGRLHDIRDRPGTVSFVPANLPRRAIYEQADLRYSALWIHPNAGALADAPAVENALINAQEPALASLIDSLRLDLAAGCMPDDGYVEQLVSVILRRIAAADRTGAPRAVRDAHASLGATVLKRIEAYVEAHLRDAISLSELAGVAGLAPDSFARRFKATTGLAPHAFVLQQRMARAETMLARSGEPIGVIAARLGFSSQSHFTATFRRHLDTTPQAYRRAFS